MVPTSPRLHQLWRSDHSSPMLYQTAQGRSAATNFDNPLAWNSWHCGLQYNIICAIRFMPMAGAQVIGCPLHSIAASDAQRTIFQTPPPPAVSV